MYCKTRAHRGERGQCSPAIRSPSFRRPYRPPSCRHTSSSWSSWSRVARFSTSFIRGAPSTSSTIGGSPRIRRSEQVGGGEMVSLAIQTAVVEVMTSGEFCNARRRIAHLLTMYGFVIYVVTTVIMVFAYPTPATPTPAILPALWYIGALMVCVGGYWFWFFIRVDVAAEGNSPFRFVRADLFIVSLVASVTLGLMWACVQTTGSSLGQRVPRLCISSPRRCCSDRFRGPNSRTCSSSPRRPCRKGWPKQTARGATCPLPPTSPNISAASADSPGIIDRPDIGLRYRR